MNYRADIDGLRAIAVLAVILFHLGLDIMGGGYVGVDVFFVISGYLIGGIIFSHVEAGHFSFAQFYERRVRRIAPAALVVIAACSVAAHLILLPSDYGNFAQSVVANAFIASNVLFWHEAGYFDTASEQKPLLHTWSLAVEEQFYLAFPFVVLLLARLLPRRRWLVVLVCLLAASFTLNVVLMSSRPDAAFFLAPPRAWELLLGAVVALWPSQRSVPRWQPLLLGVIGLSMIVWSVCSFDKDTPFPGVAATLPTAGTALVIYSGSLERSLVARALGCFPLRAIGWLSYSLYLWHWPLIVFQENYWLKPLTTVQRIATIGATFALATASWKFVEQPFRHGIPRTRRVLFLSFGLLSTATIAYGLFVYRSGGVAGRPGFEASSLENEALVSMRKRKCLLVPTQRADELELEGCVFGPAARTPTAILWGDSHAAHLMSGLRDAADRNNSALVQATAALCPPALGFGTQKNPACRDVNARVFAWIGANPSIATVILAARWPKYTRDGSLPGQVAETVRRLQAMGRRTVLVNAGPTYLRSVPGIVSRWMSLYGSQPRLAIPTGDALNLLKENRALSAGVLRVANADLVLEPTTFLCERDGCVVFEDSRSLYIDDNHLSVHGSRRLARMFDSALRPTSVSRDAPRIEAQPDAL